MTDLHDIVEIESTHYLRPSTYLPTNVPVANVLLEQGWKLLSIAASPGYELEGAVFDASFLYCLGRPASVSPRTSNVVEFGKARA